jgi:lipopolysaccharide export system permease protein
MWRSRRIIIYLLSEMLPAFLLGIVIFVSILLMFQALRLTEFVLVHGIKITTLLDIIGYMSISFLPILLPMSLLFAILMTYNRLSTESEIIAMKSTGISGWSLLTPAVFLATLVFVFSAQTAFFMAPWGNRQFEVLITQLGNTKAAASIKEGSFSEGFFDMVVYANKVDSNSGKMENLFIYDEKESSSPITIIAPRGEIIPDAENPGHSILLRLFNGEIHRSGKNHTIINFAAYDVSLNDPIRFEERKKSPPSLSLSELNERMDDPKSTDDERKTYNIEYHKRSALSFACFVFALIGVAFGIQNDRRGAKSSGFVLSVGFIILYWVLYLGFEGLARNGRLPIILATWSSNIIFMIFAFMNLRKKLN